MGRRGFLLDDRPHRCRGLGMCVCRQLTFLSDTALGKRQSFKLSSSRFALYLSLHLDKASAKDGRVGRGEEEEAHLGRQVHHLVFTHLRP